VAREWQAFLRTLGRILSLLSGSYRWWIQQAAKSSQASVKPFATFAFLSEISGQAPRKFPSTRIGFHELV
jgi:hypothetical protein